MTLEALSDRHFERFGGTRRQNALSVRSGREMAADPSYCGFTALTACGKLPPVPERVRLPLLEDATALFHLISSIRSAMSGVPGSGMIGSPTAGKTDSANLPVVNTRSPGVIVMFHVSRTST